MIVKNEGSSSHFKVMESLALTSLITLAKLVIDSPKVSGLSTLKCWKPSIDKWRLTNATWDESIAYKDMPVGVASILTSVTRSLIASTILFKVVPSINLASNIDTKCFLYINNYLLISTNVKVLRYAWANF